jgi:TatA/E family protein of Tat protein translocase
MDAMVASVPIRALFFGGGEIVLILAVVLVLFGARKLPNLAKGLGRGIYEFRKASGEVLKEIDQEAFDAGQSLGGIHGKAAAEALTPDNQTAELYDPAVFKKGEESNGIARITTRNRFSFSRAVSMGMLLSVLIGMVAAILVLTMIYFLNKYPALHGLEILWPWCAVIQIRFI